MVCATSKSHPYKALFVLPLILLFFPLPPGVTGVVVRGQLWSHEKNISLEQQLKRNLGPWVTLWSRSPTASGPLTRLRWERERTRPCFCHWSLWGKPIQQSNPHLTFEFSSSLRPTASSQMASLTLKSFWQNLQTSSSSHALRFRAEQGIHPLQVLLGYLPYNWPLGIPWQSTPIKDPHLSCLRIHLPWVVLQPVQGLLHSRVSVNICWMNKWRFLSCCILSSLKVTKVWKTFFSKCCCEAKSNLTGIYALGLPDPKCAQLYHAEELHA